jgi:hypothetical protein
MKIHMAASMHHYLRHTKAVWEHLPEDLKGEVVTRKLRAVPKDDFVMVGSKSDIELAGRNRVIYVEHGAGQAYAGYTQSARHPHYHGGKHPSNVVGYISPRQEVAESWSAPGFAAGCPALDGFEREPQPVAVLTFHWDAHMVCSEARTARPHYIESFEDIARWAFDAGFELVGHRHPRDKRAERIFRDLHIRFEPDSEQVLKHASVLIADNTSLMYEAALLDVPVIALNAPWYRKDVQHGLRFWSNVPGIQVDTAEELLAVPLAQYVADDPSASIRAKAAQYCYGQNLGGAAAARWVTDLVSTM